jgi:hypothetical protein
MSARTAKGGVHLTPEQVRKIVMEVLDARKAELDELVSRAAKSAVRETLTAIGVDTGNPIEAQATFAALRGVARTFGDPEFQADLNHLRGWRRAMSGLRQHALTFILGTLLTATIAWMVAGFQVSITR